MLFSLLFCITFLFVIVFFKGYGSPLLWRGAGGEDLMFYNLTGHHLTTLRSDLNDIRTLTKLLQIDLDIPIAIDIPTHKPLPHKVIHLIALQLLGSFYMHQTTGWIRV